MSLPIILVIISCAIVSAGKLGLSLVLDDSNFAVSLNNHQHLLVKFYAPWCKHCKSFEEQWNTAAKITSKHGMVYGVVDTDANKKLSQQFGIRYLPTVLYFKDGKFAEDCPYRSIGDLITFAEKRVGIFYSVLNDLDEYKAFVKHREIYTIGLFSSLESYNAKYFMEISKLNNVIPFGISASQDLFDENNVNGETVILVKPFEDRKNILSVNSDINATVLAEFINGYSTPLVQEFTQATSANILRNPIKSQVIYFTDQQSSYHSKLMKSAESLATVYRGKLLFMNVPSFVEDIVRMFGLTNKTIPAIVIANSTGRVLRYPYSGDMYNHEDLSIFIGKYLLGELKPALKSESVLKDDTKALVKIVRSKSFNDIVIRSKQHVFLKLSAYQCNDCKKYVILWDQLAKEHLNNEDLIFANMMADENEIEFPGMIIETVPDFYFFRINDKKHPVRYKGAKTKEGFLKFIKEQLLLSGRSDL